jgi:hypothetical protein
MNIRSNISQNLDQKSQFEYEDQFIAASLKNLWWWDNKPEGSLIECIADILPKRHWFQPFLFEFMDNRTTAIFEELVASGVLDCNIPGTQIVVGAEILVKDFGMARVTVLVGFISDILSKSLFRLVKL